MELWIRSQDRKRLGQINYIEYGKDDYGYHLIGWKDKFEGTRIGTYKTEERALEVLDEIEERIMMLNATNLIYDNVSLIGFKKALSEEKIRGLCFPYQMPEE